MASSRPGGLTALAVINFVLAGINLLQVLNLTVTLSMGDQLAARNEEFRVIWEEWNAHGLGWLYAQLATLAVGAALLIPCGIGYLQTKRVLGRLFGNVYALLSLAGAVLVVILSADVTGGGFNLGTVFAILYPILTVALVNTTFRRDFVR